MSEPSVRHDPDTVLSSIRRLVDSGTAAPGASAAAPAPVAGLAAAGIGRVPEAAAAVPSGVQPLVLTEALRVSPPAVSGARLRLATLPPAATAAPPDAPAPAAAATPAEAPAPAATPAAEARPDPDAGEFPRDAAALRALIAEVVREELRGSFGEGISRNLRRMVRAEIARALAAADLE